MTLDSQWRRYPGAPRLRPAIVRVTLYGLVVALTSANATEWHDTTDIAATAEAFLVARLGRAETSARTGTTSVKAGMLDSRLRVAACDRPLEGFLRPGSRIGSKTVVGVRCPGARPWKVYVPVRIEVRKRVWVARRALPKGHLLATGDLVADVRDISRMTGGYESNPSALVGQRLRTSVLAGRVLTPQLIEADMLIKRGQTVTLSVAVGGLSIRMAGKALMDGALNQRIRVENLNSGRVVEGIVRSQEQVEVLVPGAGSRSKSSPKVSAPLADTGYSNNDR